MRLQTSCAVAWAPAGGGDQQRLLARLDALDVEHQQGLVSESRVYEERTRLLDELRPRTSEAPRRDYLGGDGCEPAKAGAVRQPR